MPKMDSSSTSTKRQIRPSAKLGPDNDGQHQISAHRAAIHDALEKTTSKEVMSSTPPNMDSQTDASSPVPVSGGVSDHESDGADTPIAKPKRKRPALVLSDDDEEETDRASSPSTPKAKKKKPKKKRKGSGIELEGSTTLQSIDIESDAEGASTLNKTDPTADLKHFFKKVPHKKGDNKARVACMGCSVKNVAHDMVEQHTTQRRHMEAKHANMYRKWAKENNFDSMLPSDTKERRKSIAEALVQTSVDDHFKPAPPAEEKPIPYSDEIFKQAALEWLIETNQPIQAFDHPKFKKMIDIAARATRGVKLPSRKQTRKEIIRQFKTQMTALKERLNSPFVSGEISLTCDSWTAGNGDGYFTVTGHWIEELAPTEWVEREALFGFTQMNTSHSGVQLGQALYKVCNRLAVIHKIGHITCDNANNNDTMLEEFARCYEQKTRREFDVHKRHIRCLAHIINLATQALISTRSKAKHYSADSDDGHIPDLTGTDRDEVGLVRAITVKARSSSQRKELFKNVQIENKVPPRQLLLDMKVRWGSTHVMLLRAESRQKEVNEFIFQLGKKETNAEKRRKIVDLVLSEEEWTRVRLFNNLLEYADDAQQAFSAGTRPTLHNALPAIEKLYAEWEKASGKARYVQFKAALEAGMAKLDEYYKKTAASDAHVISMALNPKDKFGHFRKYWGDDLADEVEETVQKKFIERYERLHKEPTSKPVKKVKKKVPGRRNCDDTESESEAEEALDPIKPWLNEWELYLKTNETVPDGMGIVKWWGLNAHRYPTWASLARDYLAIMASSVSSERAFSSAGITISKRRSRLKGDIVEAIECLKCLIHRDLLFREVLVAKDLEAELEHIEQVVEDQDYIDVVHQGDGFSWDQLLEEEEDGVGEDMVESLD